METFPICILTQQLNICKIYYILYCYKITITINKLFSPIKVLPALRRHLETWKKKMGHIRFSIFSNNLENGIECTLSKAYEWYHSRESGWHVRGHSCHSKGPWQAEEAGWQTTHSSETNKFCSWDGITQCLNTDRGPTHWAVALQKKTWSW